MTNCMMCAIRLLGLPFFAVFAYSGSAQTLDPKATEVWQPMPSRVVPGSEGRPPSDAIILFDGKGLDAWKSADGSGAPAHWAVTRGIMTVRLGTGNIETRQLFADYQLHLEWRVPAGVSAAAVIARARAQHVPEKYLSDEGHIGQFRGNSGIFLASTGPGNAGYELQILDCWRNKTYVNGGAGSLYKQAAPLVNACSRPGEWQSYDIVWTAPRFSSDGILRSPARATVFHNGIVVQNDTILAGPTAHIGRPAYERHGAAPIKLQDHPAVPVSFRNIWVRPLTAAAD